MLSPQKILIAAAFAVSLAFSGSAAAFDTETISTDKRLSEFAAVYIAPVDLDLDFDDRDDREVSERDQEARAADFYDDLVRAFSREFAIANEPGEGVITIQATLTDLASSRPTGADFRRKPGLSFDSVYAGGAAVEIELLEDGETLAEISDDYSGNFNDGNPRVGVWQDANRAFSLWARQLVKFVRKN